MGDGGSYLLGSSLATFSLYGLTNSSNKYNLENINDILNNNNILAFHIFILLFLVPIVDMIQVVFSRIINKCSPFLPDRRHLHHKILDKGLPQRYTVIILYALSQFGVCLSLYMINIEGRIIYMCLSTIFMILSFYK